MLVKPRRVFPETLFVLRGSALYDNWPILIGLTVFAFISTEVLYALGVERFNLSVTPFSLIGLALSIFLGFRNNACYDRWWEARKLWGALINTTRSIARQTLNFVNSDDPAVRSFHQEMVRRTIGFAYGLKYHLRAEVRLDAVTAWLPDEDGAALVEEENVPNALIQRMGERYRMAWKRGWIDTYHMNIFEGSLTRLSDIQGGCERIKNTPVPLSYTVLTHRLVALYCLTLPFGIASTVGHTTPIVVLIVSFAFLGLDSLGTQLEDPFELDPNDLPLAALARTIEINLLQRIGESELPSPTRPMGGILE
ncbi:MAG: bestrophin family protein [Myxococcota bacterium]